MVVVSLYHGRGGVDDRGVEVDVVVNVVWWLQGVVWWVAQVVWSEVVSWW